MSTPNTTPAAYVVEVPAPFRTTTQYLPRRGHGLRFEYATVQPGAYRLAFTTADMGDEIAYAAMDMVVTARRGVSLGFLPWVTFHRIPRTVEFAWDLPEVGDGLPAVGGIDDTPSATFRRIA